jgi:hypothetical protein
MNRIFGFVTRLCHPTNAGVFIIEFVYFHQRVKTTGFQPVSFSLAASSGFR